MDFDELKPKRVGASVKYGRRVTGSRESSTVSRRMERAPAEPEGNEADQEEEEQLVRTSRLYCHAPKTDSRSEEQPRKKRMLREPFLSVPVIDRVSEDSKQPKMRSESGKELNLKRKTTSAKRAASDSHVSPPAKRQMRATSAGPSPVLKRVLSHPVTSPGSLRDHVLADKSNVPLTVSKAGTVQRTRSSTQARSIVPLRPPRRALSSNSSSQQRVDVLRDVPPNERLLNMRSVAQALPSAAAASRPFLPSRVALLSSSDHGVLEDVGMHSSIMIENEDSSSALAPATTSEGVGGAGDDTILPLSDHRMPLPSAFNFAVPPSNSMSALAGTSRARHTFDRTASAAKLAALARTNRLEANARMDDSDDDEQKVKEDTARELTKARGTKPGLSIGQSLGAKKRRNEILSLRDALVSAGADEGDESQDELGM